MPVLPGFHSTQPSAITGASISVDKKNYRNVRAPRAAEGDAVCGGIGGEGAMIENMGAVLIRRSFALCSIDNGLIGGLRLQWLRAGAVRLRSVIRTPSAMRKLRSGR